MSQRPWLMRAFPLELREKFFYRWYIDRASGYLPLYDSAELALARGIRMRLVPTDFCHRWIALTGFYELVLSRKIADLARKGGILFDVGANYGYYSCLWAGINRKNKVIAFEPSPLCLKGLKNNILNNDLQGAVFIKENALGDNNGISWFDLGAAEQTGWGGLSLSSGTNRVKVNVRRLDDLFDELSVAKTIDVLKIDTEGADALVLQGAKGLLSSKKIKHIFFEENIPRMEALNVPKNSARDLLASCGYRVEYLSPNLLSAKISK